MYKIRKYRKSNDISAGNWLGQQLTWEGERERKIEGARGV